MIKLFFLTFVIILFFAVALGLKAFIKNEDVPEHSCKPEEEKGNCALCSHGSCTYSKVK